MYSKFKSGDFIRWMHDEKIFAIITRVQPNLYILRFQEDRSSILHYYPMAKSIVDNSYVLITDIFRDNQPADEHNYKDY